MKKIIPFVFLLISTFSSNAQDFCKASSVFFDLNKSELKSEGQVMVDSLVKSMNGADFILEVYGFTDTSNTLDYNRKLSQSRIDAVLAYLKLKQITPKEIRTFNEGEDFNSSNLSRNAAFQRRVDVYLTPMEGNDVTFNSPDGVIIKRDLSSFGNCGICALKPKMKYLQTENEANANGIDLLTNKGERLVTYGMVLFDIDTCSSIPAEMQKTFKTCMQIPVENWNDQVKLFELVNQPGNDVWNLLKDSMSYNPEKKIVSFCTIARKINCDAYGISPSDKMNLILPEESQGGKSFFIHLLQKKAEKLYNDTIKFPNDIETVISYFPKEKDWYLFQESRTQIVSQFLNRDSISPTSCSVYSSDYTVVTSRGEIELKVKLKDYDKIGYYHADFDLFIPLKRKEGNTYFGQIYEDGFELCYIKSDRYYTEKNKAKSMKIKIKDGLASAKIKQKYLFKKNRLGWKRAKRMIL
jgi:hypothetical protein